MGSPHHLQPVNTSDLPEYPLSCDDRLDSHFSALCKLEYGPLYKWEPCRCDNGDIRLMHPMVLRSLTEAMARRQDHRARNDAANSAKRLQRLRITVSGYHADLAKNDAAVRWMDDWLMNEGCEYRSAA